MSARTIRRVYTMPKPIDRQTLEAAIAGYQQQLEKVNARIADLNRRLGKPGRAAAPANSGGARTHHVSAAGRARIAAAQRKRWAAMRKKKPAEE